MMSRSRAPPAPASASLLIRLTSGGVHGAVQPHPDRDAGPLADRWRDQQHPEREERRLRPRPVTNTPAIPGAVQSPVSSPRTRPLNAAS